MTLRLSDELHGALRATAEQEHRSMQQVAVTAIEQYVTARTRRRDQAISRVVDRDQEILDRLG